jgi:uncharacterized membrane protein YciS (DUF1049 family)
MAALLLLLAIVGVVLAGDLVVENTAAGDVSVWHYSITGYSEGELLAMAAALGFVLGLLVVGSVCMRRTRRARRRQLRTAERDLTDQLDELERENASLRKVLGSTPVDRHPEPVYEEARRAARLRSDLDL